MTTIDDLLQEMVHQSIPIAASRAVWVISQAADMRTSAGTLLRQVHCEVAAALPVELHSAQRMIQAGNPKAALDQFASRMEQAGDRAAIGACATTAMHMDV